MNIINEKYEFKDLKEKDVFIIRSLLTNEGLNRLRNEIKLLIENSSKEWLINNTAKDKNGEYAVIRSIDIPSDLIFKLGRNDTLIHIAEKILNKKVTPMYSEYFNKAPYSDYPTPIHQDQVFYEKHFNDELAITFWIPLDDINRNNGGMNIKSLSSNILLEHQKSDVLGFGYEMINQEKEGFEEISLNAGDCLIHNAYTLHYCESNKTSSKRRAIAITFRTSQYREENK